MLQVVGAAVIPHGDFAYDPSLVHNKNGSLLVHAGAQKAGQYLSDLNPDIILLTTPHGMALTNDFAIYKNSAGDGFARSAYARTPCCCLTPTPNP